MTALANSSDPFLAILLVPAMLFALSACRPPERQKHEKAPAIPKLTVTTVDGGPLTMYDDHVKGRTKPVRDTTLRRSFVILNDPTCPVQVTSFSLRTEDPGRTWEELGYRLAYIDTLALMPHSSVTAWEIHDIAFDAMNRYLWADAINNEARTGDTKQLEPGVEHRTERWSAWKANDTDKLSTWITSILFVSTIRTADGKVWVYDKDALRLQMKQLSFDSPAEKKE
jgi:hypothetical protein